MKILLIGSGSIGKKHLLNIIDSGYKDITIITRKKKQEERFRNLASFKSIEEAIAINHYAAAVVCTPTSHHVADVNLLLNAGIKNIYLEKPVSHNYDGIEALLKMASESQCRIMIGYDLHFDPGLQKVKELISGNIIGRILSVNATAGQYLPEWRPYEDHKKGTSARVETGGGVLLDLIHEFDYLYQLIGEAEIITAHTINSGVLDIETEELAEVLLKFSNGTIASIHLDYLQPILVRNCRITGTAGSIYWDMALQEIKWILADKNAFYFSYKEFERNDRFKEIIQVFLRGSNDKRLTSLEQGIKSLQMVLAAKYSAKNKVSVSLNNFNLL